MTSHVGNLFIMAMTQFSSPLFTVFGTFSVSNIIMEQPLGFVWLNDCFGGISSHDYNFIVSCFCLAIMVVEALILLFVHSYFQSRIGAPRANKARLSLKRILINFLLPMIALLGSLYLFRQEFVKTTYCNSTDTRYHPIDTLPQDMDTKNLIGPHIIDIFAPEFIARWDLNTSECLGIIWSSGHYCTTTYWLTQWELEKDRLHLPNYWLNDLKGKKFREPTKVYNWVHFLWIDQGTYYLFLWTLLLFLPDVSYTTLDIIKAIKTLCKMHSD